MTIEFTWNLLTSDSRCAEIPIGLFFFGEIGGIEGILQNVEKWVASGDSRLSMWDRHYLIWAEYSWIFCAATVPPKYHCTTVTKLWSSVNNVLGNRAEAVDISQSRKRREPCSLAFFSIVRFIFSWRRESFGMPSRY